MFTQRHYVAIAAILDSARSQHGGSVVLDEIVTELCSLFARDNERFNRTRFLAACGMS